MPVPRPVYQRDTMIAVLQSPVGRHYHAAHNKRCRNSLRAGGERNGRKVRLRHRWVYELFGLQSFVLPLRVGVQISILRTGRSDRLPQQIQMLVLYL